jgi:hypothetical protein
VTANGTPVISIGESGVLPNGVTFTDNGDGTATLAGTPTVIAGSYPLTITASNGVGSDAVQAFTLKVSGSTGAPSITSAAGATFTVGVTGAFTVTAIGTPTPASITESGSLPSGVTFTNNANGSATLAGTPASGTNGSYPLTITASNGVLPNAAQSFTLTVSLTGNHLAFITQPGGGAAGAIWTAQPVVAVENASNAVVSDNSTVYLSIATNPAGGTLSCTGGMSEVAVNGYAYFSGCSINLASSSYYTLYATSSAAWTPATSSAFYVGGTGTALTISPTSALGLTPASGFSTSTPKYTTVGKYVTWKFNGGSALAAQRVNVLLATRVAGVWSLPKYLKSAWADGTGIVTLARTLGSAGAINIRIQWPGNTTYAVSTSKALGAYWK